MLRLLVSTVSSGRVDARRIAAEYLFSLPDLFCERRVYVDETDITRTRNEWGAPIHSTIHTCTVQSSRQAYDVLPTCSERLNYLNRSEARGRDWSVES